MKHLLVLAASTMLFPALTTLSPAAWAIPAPPAITQIANDAIPAVVDISSIDPLKRGGHGLGAGMEAGSAQAYSTRESTGALIVPPKANQALGTGFFISPNGYIVTNHHVIAGASQITVTMQNGSVYDARRVGVDKVADLAVLKVEAPGPFPYLQFGSSRKLELGDWVVAIGNPFGLGTSISAGIVSALHRNIDSGKYDDFIQTDAAINRGNSGGPLLNAFGHVIGVDSAIYSPSGGSVGVGFAIPSSMVQPVAAQLIAHGQMDRGWIGLRIEDVSDAMKKAWHLQSTAGVVVAEAVANGPAGRVLKPGDLITAIDGRSLTDAHSLSVSIGERAVGQKVHLTFFRRGILHRASILVSSPKSLPIGKLPYGKKSQPKPDHLLALGISAIAAPGADGVLVVAITADGPAKRAGLAVNSVIQAVGPVFVTTPGQLEKQLAGRKQASLLVNGPNGPAWIVVNLTHMTPQAAQTAGS